MGPTPVGAVTPDSLWESQLATAERAILLGGTAVLVLGIGLGALSPTQAPIAFAAAAAHVVLAPLVAVARRHAGLQLRTFIILGYILVTCSVALWLTGPLVGAGAGLTAATIGAARFFGWRGAILSSLAICIVLGIAGAAYTSGMVQSPQPIDANWDRLDDWLRIAGTTATVNLLVALALGPIATQLERAYAEAKGAFDELRRRRSEREAGRDLLAVAARDEALGRLAGGVAHDVNNALAVILTNAQLLSETLPSTNEDRLLADEIVAAAQRAAETTRGLLMLGRSQLEPERSLPAAEACERLVQLLRRTCPETVTISLERSGTRRPSLDASALEQVVLSHALDALDIVGPEGSLLVRVADVDEAPDLRGVRIEIESVRSLPAPSDPWETIGEARRSLPARASQAVSDRVLAGVGGRTSFVDTATGSTIRLDLPEAAEPVAADLDSQPTQAAEPGRRILLVDDEDAVRRTIVRILERKGHALLTARDGASATSIFDADVQIDLLLTDAVMPNTNTAEMIRAFRRRHPNVPVIVCSGYVKEELVRRDIAEGAYDFLKKPFTPDELRDIVERALAVPLPRAKGSL